MPYTPENLPPLKWGKAATSTPSLKCSQSQLAGKVSEEDILAGPVGAARDQHAPDPQSWPKVKCLKLAGPGLSSACKGESLSSFSQAGSAF